jgi:hypothetical protein
MKRHRGRTYADLRRAYQSRDHEGGGEGERSRTGRFQTGPEYVPDMRAIHLRRSAIRLAAPIKATRGGNHMMRL